MNIPQSPHERVVIAGGGFAGLELAKALRNKNYQVVLLDKNNHFTFQPLLYQVATGGLEPNSIAFPLRRIFRKADNVAFRMAEVEAVHPEKRQIDTSIGPVDFDHFVIATGTRPKFFGLEQSRLLPLKSVPQALQMRNHVLKEFEKAVVTDNKEAKEAYTNFVVVGGGPTGVELAGALGEMKKFVLMNIYLVEGLDRLLPAMSEASSKKAKQYLEELGVQVRLNTMIDEYDGEKVELDGQHLPTRNLIWTAGVAPNPVEGLEDALRDTGRISVDEHLRVSSYDHIYAIGDVAEMASEDNPKGYPMLAPVAIQQGKHLAKNLIRRSKGKTEEPFEYFDKGTMATVGRNRAVADIRQLQLGGLLAWLAWMFVHLITLVGFRNRVVVAINWIYNYFTYDKALRLIIKRGSNKEEFFEEAPSANAEV
ncbi:MAG: FAD-dependent oxidoreductase [Bacteroidetes bacterium]|jgi:NADH dehydrogenase|nr:FAD-dependent oxidoreductase [Bacteroidota bacterium]